MTLIKEDLGIAFPAENIEDQKKGELKNFQWAITLIPR